MASTILPLTNAQFASFHSHHSLPSIAKWGWRREQDAGMASHRIQSQAFRVLANPNVSSGKDGSKKDVIMVDPVEAKRLAAKQMERIKAKEKLKKRRQIEAVNGAWAMIGLTVGLVIEGQTGKSIMTQVTTHSFKYSPVLKAEIRKLASQLQDYFGAIIHLFVK